MLAPISWLIKKYKYENERRFLLAFPFMLAMHLYDKYVLTAKKVKYVALAMMVMMMFYLSFYAVAQTTYTADLDLNTSVLYKSQADYIEFHVHLGGATSSPDPASLRVYDSERTLVNDLGLENTGGGRYVCVVPLQDFAPGVCEAELSYPHPHVNLSYPLIHADIESREGFVVMP